MLSEEALRRASRSAGLTAPVRWDETTESTNSTALAMARRGRRSGRSSPRGIRRLGEAGWDARGSTALERR